METTKTCPGCHQPLAPNAPDGLCPACLMRAGLGTGADLGLESQAERQRTPFVTPSLEEMARLFPQLEILGLVGQGGMGAVYKARQRALGRVVALKVLPPGIGREAAFAERFMREARALARLNHPGIVTLYEFGEVGQASSQPPESLSPETAPPAPGATPAPPRLAGKMPAPLFYFLMEFVDGMNLRHLLEVERISAREALGIVPQICDALQYAHDQGIVHRDIKPENILLDRQGRVKVADFGLAKLVGTEALTPTLFHPMGEGMVSTPPAALTEADKVMGTPQYMAPEQRDHPTEVDHRADIYALGVVFYQMLTGELPGRRLEPPSRKVLIDVRLDEVVLRALEKDPARRYQQVSQVRTAVETIATTPPQGRAAPPEAPHPADTLSPWCRIVSLALGESFTSPLAIKLINLSALGFLGALAFLGFVPLPRMQGCLGFAGFSGFFGLIGVGIMVERSARRKVQEMQGGPPAANPPGSPIGPAGPPLREPSNETHPRCSRTAIVGAAWAPLFFMVFGAFFGRVEVSYGEYHGPEWWQYVLMFTLLPLGFAAPFGTTLLGWMAVSQIRRSAGRLYGMGLAVFDGLFFPLLVLGGLTAWFWWWAIHDVICSAITEGDPPLSPLARMIMSHQTGLCVLATLATAALLGFFIIRAVWRAVSRPLGNASGRAGLPPAEPGAGPSAPSANPPQAPPAGAPAPRLLKVGTAYLTTPEELGTFQGQFFLWRRRDQLLLDDRQLTISRAGTFTVIPLAAIRDLSLGHYPRVMNPVGLDFISVTYDEAGQSRRLFFSPHESVFGLPSTFNRIVAEWLAAIRATVTAATGHEPGITPAAQLGVPPGSKGIYGLFLLALLPAGVALLAILKMTSNGAARPALLGGPVVLIGAMLAFALLATFMFAATFQGSRRRVLWPWVLGAGVLLLLAVPVLIVGFLLFQGTARLETLSRARTSPVMEFRGEGPNAIRPPGQDPLPPPPMISGVETTVPVIPRVVATPAYTGDLAVYDDYLGSVGPLKTDAATRMTDEETRQIPVVFSIPETRVQEVVTRLRANQELAVEVYNAGMKKIGIGSLLNVAGQMDAATGMLTCQATVERDGDAVLLPNMFLHVRLRLEVKHGVTLLPAMALQNNSQGRFVYLIKADDTVTLRPVTVETIQAGTALVGEGVTSGDWVVLEPSQKLEEGQPVRLTRLQAGATQAPAVGVPPSKTNGASRPARQPTPEHQP